MTTAPETSHRPGFLSVLVGEALRLESYDAAGLIDLDEPVPG